MTNEEAIQLLSARVDGELTPEQEQAVDAWLRENPDGKIVAEAFRCQDAEVRVAFEARREAAAMTAERVGEQCRPVALRPELRSQSDRSTLAQPNNPTQLADLPKPASHSRRRRFLSILPPFTAAAVLACVAMFWLRSEKPHDRPPVGPSDSSTSLAALPGLLQPRQKPAPAKAVVAKVGDRFKTAPGEKKRFELDDGSILYLNQNAEVQFTESRYLKLTKGEIFVEAKPANADAELGTFKVETPQRTVTALGTKFAVESEEKSLSVLVAQGSVKVDGINESVVAGQLLKAVVDKEPSLEPARRASHDLDWTRELMVAADTPLVPSGKYDGGALVAVDPYGQEAKLSLVNYRIDVHIEDGFARTTIDQTYFNHENMQMEGTFYFPLPPDASLSRLAMYVANGETANLMEGGMTERDYARQTYERIRDARRDPALLEWVDGSLFKMRVFPLEARQEKRLVLSYSQKLPVLYGRTSYRFPAGHTMNQVKHWSFHGVVKGGAALSAMSPSHPGMQFVRKDGDLVMTDKADAIKPDRDVTMEFSDHQLPTGETARWSSAEHENAKYVMLRYKPDLQAAPRRERRDWVFLYESSGARDPLVARVQVEVIRALLNNAEHDDSFSILTVGTRIHKFSDEPQPATAENVQKALAFLDKTHLIGALNLEQALIEAEPFLKAGNNPHLVHVGGGIATLGEHRSDKLMALIPQGTRFVGVAVGKRFSPAFMKVAAEKTGGFFTQINPDEPIAWRGFDLAATLNTPRLLNITVEAPAMAGETPVRFLTFTNALSQGEELAAVARVDSAMPASVTVRGWIDGTSFEKTIPIRGVAPNAGYLPRTWAKLEIDRLLAEDYGQHRQQIVEMSKAMYVMTPYTSLLVLENEEMYKEFKVDRGRKDHWAMYPCPDKVPVVFIPDPNQPFARNAPEFVNRKPHENVVMQTIMTRRPVRYVTWPGRDNNDPGAVGTAGQIYGEANAEGKPEILGELDGLGAGLGGQILGRHNTNGVSTLWNGFATDWMDVVVEAQKVEEGAPGLPNQNVEFLSDLKENKRVRYNIPEMLNTIGKSPPARAQIIRAQANLSKAFADGESRRFSRDFYMYGERLLEEGELQQGLFKPLPTGGFAGVVANDRWDGLGYADGSMTGIPGRFMGNVDRDEPLRFDKERFNQIKNRTNLNPSGGQIYPYITGALITGVDTTTLPGSSSPADPDPDPRVYWGRGLTPIPLGLPELTNEDLGLDSELRPAISKLDDRVVRLRNLSQGIDRALARVPAQAPRYYGRPSFSAQERVFTDLAAYAPGMSSSRADIQAVLEAEAAPRFGQRKGSIDKDALKLIESARSAEWRTFVCKDATGKDFNFSYDGSGRYTYEHRLALGLIERVVCDGSTLLHLYPELGIGARRTVSRFHRAELANLLPDVLPPAEDFAHGADVRLVDKNTVAIVPLPPAAAEEQPKNWLEIHLVFADKKLVERRTLIMPEKKVLAREVYSQNEIKLVDAGEKNSIVPESREAKG